MVASSENGAAGQLLDASITEDRAIQFEILTQPHA